MLVSIKELKCSLKGSEVTMEGPLKQHYSMSPTPCRDPTFSLQNLFLCWLASLSADKKHNMSLVLEAGSQSLCSQVPMAIETRY